MIFSDCFPILAPQENLGFEPRINLKDGLNKLLLWYMDSKIPPEQLLESESELNWLT